MYKHLHLTLAHLLSDSLILFVKTNRIAALAVLLGTAALLQAQTTVIWDGEVDSDWATPGNWNGDAVPLTTDDVLIPSAPANQPVIGSTTMAFSKSVVIAQNASLQVNGGTLSVSGAEADALTVNGSINNGGTIAITNAHRYGFFVSGIGSASNSGLISVDIAENAVFNSNILNNTGDIKIKNTTSHGFVNAGTFTNEMDALLDIRNVGAFRGIDNYAGITNYGQVFINHIAETGISNNGTFTNKPDGSIDIADVGEFTVHPGISNGSTFTNEGTITIAGPTNFSINTSGSFANSGQITLNVSLSNGTGITNSGSFSNTNMLTINNAGSFGIFHQGTLFENSGTITLNCSGSTDNAIHNKGDFDNKPNGLIDINSSGRHGIENAGGSADFTNEGTIDIDGTGTGAVNGIGIRNEKNFSNLASIIIKNTKEYGILNMPDQIFSNGTSAGISIQNSLSDGIINYGTFTGPSILTITGAGNFGIDNASSFTCNGTATITNSANAGVFNSGTFDNTGSLSINSPSDVGYYQQGSTPQTNNSGTLTINTTTNNKDGVYVNNGTFSNQGNVTVNNIARWGIFVASDFDNVGSNSVVNINSTGNNGLHLDGTFDNGGTVNIGTTENVVAGHGINGSTGQFNNSGTVLLGKNIGSFGLNSPFSNAAQGSIKGNGSIAGNFTNDGGTLSPGESPGILTFPGNYNQGTGIYQAEIFGLAGPGVIGGYDQLVVTGTATLGGTIQLVVNYTPANNDEAVIITAGSLSGTFSTESLPPGWFLEYDYPATGQVTARFGILPVELVSFRAEVSGGTMVQLAWTTASETNNDFFSVERSADGTHFMEIGRVQGKGTFTGGSSQYVFLDENPVEGTAYYRLRQVDFDGRFEYSPVRSVFLEAGRPGPSMAVFPNPASGAVICTVKGAEGAAILRLFDATGQLVLSDQVESGQQQFDWGALPRGTYWLHLLATGVALIQRVVLE